MSTVITISLLIGLMIAVVAFCIRMFIITSKVQNAARLQQARDRAAGISRFDSIIHIGGLNAPQNCKCSVILNPNGLTVICGGNEFLLRLNKIKNVDYQLDIDEKRYLKSSMAAGIAGAAMFGVSGAVIGSVPKTKTKREVKCYAIISYEGTDGGFKTFILKDEVPNLSRCAKLVDSLKPMIQQQVNRVEL